MLLKNIKLSVVITVYSETFSIIETVERLFKKDRGYILEIILVMHPKTSEESLKICQNLAKKYSIVKLYTQKNTPGLGWALREGMDEASGNYIAIMSSDLETEPEAIDRMVRKIEQTDCDLVVGNRWLKGGGFVNYDKFKLILNWIFQNFFRVLYWTKIGDITYGLKITKTSLVKRIKWEGTLHEIAIETTIKPLKMGAKVEQVPTVWTGRREGISRNTFWKNFRYVKMAFHVLFY